MPFSHRMRLMSAAVATAAVVALAGCAQTTSGTEGAPSSSTAGADAFPVTIEHAYGSTTIEQKPTRIATVAWANDEVPLALGVVPVGMAKAAWGDDDGDGVLPWVEDRLQELGAKTPVLFDETEGIDFEAVAATKPDVILAAYSGLSKSDYETLSKIAPVVAFPGDAWTTSMSDMILMDSKAIGLATEGQELVDSLDAEVAADAAKVPALAGKSALFAYLDPKDLSKIGFYTPGDPRAALFEQVGMATPEVVTESAKTSKSFYIELSAEEAQRFQDVDVIVTYGDSTTLKALQADPLLSKIPAVEKGAVVVLPNSTPLAAAANPTPLSIGWGMTKYLDLLGAAADKAA